MTLEVERWKSISPDTLSAFKDPETNMINEYAFMWAKRKDFPLHYFVFRQTASLPLRATLNRSSLSAVASQTQT